ncbi:FMN adenylyltransferase [Candidatus Kaiserbacteria bacterium CG10_big_fil_rev_8_21_14_0_10_59_10]|uniref:riboflavin kinase n=1 Tax=Candidatus Kaiserbacteria bacterium CG10_big_fil_rev_8_21_14_0_10_59_10 TaxID=1974612 RepID=A0A2H0U8P0_9BACT|nr:MAG: FMN adenylyltransferase [Candidatus Kaiserbacteria bacterium CG10_big_fil_rev_8_21_14_0_10_59_10]
MKVFSGVAQRGEGRAGSLGFPTANIPLGESVLSGVYAGRVEVKGKRYDAAIFADQNRGILEAYLLDFWGELYGQEMTIELGEKLRDAKSFANDDELRAAITADVERVRALAPAATR